ncbi:hypothetical protein [Candidatus Sodalis sp. SoCistrobi]|uniref:hypothetical protein n=1 Tax=Candidatus Sodalis sp. SoCistrobi TaxID=1922216 RepID=UPI000F7779CF|nr:hypothetical protein [Candidatus Sodalis sp. SoCistrobi]
MIDYFDKWGILASKKTRNLLSALPPLTKKIWENDHNNTITLPLPYDKYLPQLHYIKKTVDHITLSATEIVFSIEKAFIENNDYIIKVNQQRVAEIKNGKSDECQLTEITDAVVCSLPYDLAADDLVEVCLAVAEDAYLVWQGSIDYITAAKRLASFYTDDKTIANWVTQADLDSVYKSIIAIQHTNDLLPAYHDAQRLFLTPMIDKVTVTETKIDVLFNMIGIENYRYVFLYNGKYLAELDKLQPYYSSWHQPNRWSITKPVDADLETISIEVRMSTGNYTLFEKSRIVFDLEAELDDLYVDEDKKVIKPDVDQYTLSNLYQRIVALDEDLKDNPLLREIDQAELIFLRQSIQDFTLQRHQIQVFFFPEHYTELKYVLSKQGNYVSEVNQGEAYYSSIKDDIWLTTVEAAPGNSFSIEGRVNDKIYTIITQTA